MGRGDAVFHCKLCVAFTEVDVGFKINEPIGLFLRESEQMSQKRINGASAVA